MSQVFVHSRGEYISLPEDFLAGKAIIRMHNSTDKEWYEHEMKNGIVFFFDDMKSFNLSFLDKFKAQHMNGDYRFFTKQNCLQLLQFIEKNKKKDMVVHCEYGKSRSVAVAVFLRDHFKYEIANQSQEELKTANDWMLTLLEKYGS